MSRCVEPKQNDKVSSGAKSFASFLEIADFLWQNAERMRGTYRPNEYDINAVELYQKVRESLGNKRNELSSEHIGTIARIFGDFRASEISKIFDNEDFGYRRIIVERPLRLAFQASPERLARLSEEKAFAALASPKKKGAAGEQEAVAGRELQEAIVAALVKLDPQRVYKDRELFDEELSAAPKRAGVSVAAPVKKAILAALSERDESADICTDGKRRSEPDSDLRDYENVPLKEDIAVYFEREVKPHVPDAWIAGVEIKGRKAVVRRSVLQASCRARWRRPKTLPTGCQVCASCQSSSSMLSARCAKNSSVRRWARRTKCSTYLIPDIRRLAIPVPSRDEQECVMVFLQDRLPRIDELIAKKERLVALLAEKRQALITQAVTKGLDPSVPMKDSGGEYVERTPSDWKVVPLRHLLSFVLKDGVFPPLAASDGALSLSLFAVRDGKVRIEGHEKYVELAPSTIRDYALRCGDILLTRGNGNLELVGSCGLVDEVPEGCTYLDILMRMRTNREVRADFLVAAINSPYVRSQMELMTKTSNGTYKVSGEDVRALMICVPAREVQDRLVPTLIAEADRLHFIEARVRTSATKLGEYRQALIAAAVTGKLDLSASSQVDDTIAELEAAS